LVSLGRVDRDYGPKSTEEVMIDFMDSVMLNASHTDIKNSIDADQWIKNFAAYAVTLNYDSVVGIENNWYLATVDNGESWSIVQYDHNLIASRAGGTLCSSACGFRTIYHPILRPSCGAVKDHDILGRVLNDKESWQLYLKYVEDFVGVVEFVIDDLWSYGNDIKPFIVDDPFAFGVTAESYEKNELGSDYSEYNTEAMPFLKTLLARLDEVNAQLEAIKSETLPRGGVYSEGEVCPDWRDEDGTDYMSGYIFDSSCGIPDCSEAAPCYDDTPFTCLDGNLVVEECKQASPICDGCFPFSSCGGLKEDTSSKFVESETCGPLLSECRLATACFNHKNGVCAFDGSILIEECREAELYCKTCFPGSRCGVSESSEDNTVMMPTTPHMESSEETTVSQPLNPSIEAYEETGTSQPSTSPMISSEDTTASQPVTSPSNDSAKAGVAIWISASLLAFYTSGF